MCSNYVAVSTQERLLQFFGVYRDDLKEQPEVFPLRLAPFIKPADPGSGNKRVAVDGMYGMLPHFTKELAFGRKTYNARSETVHSKPSFRQAWKNGWRCIIPAEALYEPRYPDDGGAPVRHRVTRPGFVPFGIAGIYREWSGPDGAKQYTFAMVTVNCDGHPFYGQFHAPDDEKRMPIMLDESEYDDWLFCPVADAPRFFKQYMGPMEAEPAPLPSRAKKAATPKPKPPDPQQPLF